MRVVFDCLGSPASSGGMRLHATRVVSTWKTLFPSDELHLIGPEWIDGEPGFEGVSLHRWPNESVFVRGPGQLFATAVLARRIDARAVISLSPIVTPFSGRTTVAFQHDWRHLKNPSEFSRVQRAYRRLWAWSSRWADFNACISEKTLNETVAVSPGASVRLLPNGFDDATSWPVTDTRRVPGQIATFGHHNNKRPELMIRALPYIRHAESTTLVVLGASGAYRDELAQLAQDVGVASAVSFPGFVGQREYEAVISSSSLVALASSDEGFGLPIAEAACLAIPALVTSDSGMAEIFGDYPVVADPDPESIAAAATQALSEGAKPGYELPHTWTSTVTELRRLTEEFATVGAR